MKIEQGDLLKVGGVVWPVIVVSNSFFNASGKAIVCPIVKDALEGPLHIPLKNCPVEGYVLCEQVRYLDLSVRRFSRITATPYFDIMVFFDFSLKISDSMIFSTPYFSNHVCFVFS